MNQILDFLIESNLVYNIRIIFVKKSLTKKNFSKKKKNRVLNFFQVESYFEYNIRNIVVKKCFLKENSLRKRKKKNRILVSRINSGI